MATDGDGVCGDFEIWGGIEKSPNRLRGAAHLMRN